MGAHIAWHKEQTRVTVESPAQLTLQARTSDGNVTLSGLQGDLGLTTGDGNVTLDRVSGNLRIKSGDGQVKITNADGAIDAHTSDGSLSVDGLFHALALHTSDGTLDPDLREGTKFAGASTIQSSDGSVTLRVPRTSPPISTCIPATATWIALFRYHRTTTSPAERAMSCAEN